MTLEEQFEKSRRVVKSPGGVTNVVDIGVSKSNLPPIFIASGWGESLSTTKSITIELARTGRRVLVAEYSHLDQTLTESKDFPPHGYIKALALLKLMKTKNIKKVDVVAHSEGSVNAIIAAWIAPKIFNKIILVTPAGMMEQDDFIRLTGRFSLHLFYYYLFHSQQKFKFTLAYVQQVVKFVLLNPIQSLGEAVGLANFKIAKIIKELQDRKMNIHIIHNSSDTLFPINNVENIVNEMKIKNFHTEPGGHNAIHEDPKNFASLLSRILN